ncbi:hypothetical protein CAPTEDRAFT_188451 [Capitella teleta]|uniref:Uncharacterized protein n=1 Tax=Capitella teleta TaxID=283909 RepID=R7ULU0_CAPTE|nr:hypothetical protein CAPTEDRAFT_188451 [Capitella teleta]|eukprot:ELU04247.1 hypothetical protein CAPTEDRAFT_188451 [Capitella teleta]
MSCRYSQSKDFFILVPTLWQKAQAARANKQLPLMKSLIERIVRRCNRFSWMDITSDVRSTVSEVLLLAGKECNACMATYLATDCFFCAIEILDSVSRCERSGRIMSESLECLVQTHLQNDDMESARVLMDDWNGRLFTSDHQDIMATVGRANMALGLAYAEDACYRRALDYLTPAVQDVLHKHDPEFRGSESEGIFASALGNCLYMESGAVSALDTVRQARLIWKSLNWPFEHVDYIVGSLKIHMEYRELIIINMGGLYHEKAEKLHCEGQEELSTKYHDKALAALQKASIDYPESSVPFFNYGYYLYSRGSYFEATTMLSHSYHYAIEDRGAVEFDHSDEHILIDDLRHELQGKKSICIPCSVISLYLKTLAQVKMGYVSGARDTVGVLEQEVRNCKYADYHCKCYSQDEIEGVCKSLVRYALRDVDN